jgi:hypothetical protein
MPATERFYRLRIRNAADDADAFVITSDPAGTNPYLTAAPEGDGQELDLLESTTSVGSYTFRFADAVVTTAEASVGADSFETYGEAVIGAGGTPWTEHLTAGAASASFSIGEPVGGYGPAPAGAYAVGLSSLTGSGGTLSDPESAYIERTFSGLTPSVSHTVTVRINGTGGTAGMEVAGATTVRTLKGASFDTDYQTVTIVVDSTAGGALTVRLGAWDHTGAAGVNYWDDLRIYEGAVTGEGRVGTRELADAGAEQQLLSRRAYGETSEDGATWAELVGGYLTAYRLDTPIEWEFTVSDTDRLDTVTNPFRTASEDLGGFSCLIGGPVAGLTTSPPPTYTTGGASFGPVGDYGPCVFEVVAVGTDVVTLFFQSGYLRPFFAASYTSVLSAEADAINAQAGRYFVEDEDTWSSGNIFGWFPDLVARLQTGGTVHRLRPIAAATRKVQAGLLGHRFIGPQDALISTNTTSSTPFNPAAGQQAGYLYLDWPASGTDHWDEAVPAQPSVGATFNVLVYPREISADAPQHLIGHPVSIVTRLWDRYGIAYDAASATAATTTLDTAWGGAIVAGYRIGDPETTLKDFTRGIASLFGFAWRFNASGERQFVCTRVRPTATQTITNHDLRGFDAPVFAIEEGSVVKGVKVTGRRFAFWDPELDEGDGPVDAVLEEEQSKLGEVDAADDAEAFSDRVHEYDLPGYVTVGGDPVSVPALVKAIGDVVVAMRARGVVVCELECLPSVTAQVGDEVVVEASHLPVSVAGASPVTQRVGENGVGVPMRVVRRTETPAGPDLKLEQVAPNEQDAAVVAPEQPTDAVPVPTFTLAADVSDPTRNVLVTVTNDATLIALGAAVLLEWSVQATEPTGSGDNTDSINPLDPPTTVLEQATTAAQGATVWVRAQTMDPRTITVGTFTVPVGIALSDWSAWQSITLDAAEDGGDLTPPSMPALAITFDGSGTPTATLVGDATVASAKIALSDTAVPDSATVRAATADASPPYSATGGFTVDVGSYAYAAAYAYDALGNESPLAVAIAARPSTAVGGGGGGTGTRTTVTFTTASIGAGATGTGTATIAKGFVLYKVQADYSCRVRLYASTAARDDDVTDRPTTDISLPTPGTGVLADSSVSSLNSLTQKQAPPPVCFSDDATTTIAYAVSSYMTAATPFEITLTILPIES